MKKKDLYIFSGFFTFFVFILFSLLVSLSVFSRIDYAATVKFQNFIPDFLITPFSVFSVIGTAEVTGVILILVVLLFTNVKKIYVLILFVLVSLIEIAGKLYIVHPAPPAEFLKTNISLGFPSGGIPHAIFYSYPSGHSARTAFISGVLILLVLLSNKLTKTQKKIAIFAVIIFDFFMFLSRVYLGEHWVTDVVGGALLGFSLAFLISYFLNFSASKK